MSFTSWFLSLVASTAPIKQEFSVADPTAMGNPVRSLILAIAPSDETSPESVISLYWQESQDKVYEKRFDVEEEARETFAVMARDLEEAQAQTKANNIEEAKRLVDELFKAYSVRTDTIVPDNVPPVTTTNATVKSQNPLVRKTARIVMQNVFFDTPEEAMEYQEKMKKLQPNDSSSAEGKPLWEQNSDSDMGDVDLGADDLADGSMSYEQVEKQRAEETKNIDKRIEKEVKDQISSELESKKATLFTAKDEELANAMRGVGRTWEEISDYMKKSLKYDEDSIALFIDEMRSKEEGVPQQTDVTPEPTTPEAPKPPKETVSPETHDRLVDELMKIDETPEPEPEIEPVPEPEPEIKEESALIADIDRADNSEIRKVALNPLQEPPTMPEPMSDEGPAPVAPSDSVTDTVPANGDRVYVMADYESNEEGFEGTKVSDYKQRGDSFAVIESDDGQMHEVAIHRVVKASLRELTVEAKRNEDVIRMFVSDSFPKDKRPIWGTEHVKITKEDNGWSLVNYATPILYRSNYDPDLIYFNTDRYSVTTTRLQNKMRAIMGGGFQEVDEEGIMNAIRANPNEPQRVEPEQQPQEPSPAEPMPEQPAPKASALLDLLKEAEALLKTATDGEIDLEADDLPAAPPVFKDVKIAPPNTDREQAVPASPELAQVLTQFETVEANLASIEALKKQVQERLAQEIKNIEDKGNRVQLEAEYKQLVEKISVLLEAVDSKTVSYKDKMYRVMEEEKEKGGVPTPSDILSRLVERVPGIAKKVDDIKNGFKALAQRFTQKTVKRFPRKMSKLDKQASVLDDLKVLHDELLGVLQELSGGDR